MLILCRKKIFFGSGGSVNVCSFCAPRAGTIADVRVAFWQELVVTARHAHSTINLPMVIAGDANIFASTYLVWSTLL